MSELRDLHVVITGAGGGLGPAVVDAFVAAGAICHLPTRGRAPASDDRRHWTGGVDLTDEAGVTAFYSAIPALWASVHVAGGFAAAPFADTSLVAWRAQLDVNLTTAFLCCREAVRAMRRSAPARGRIVNVSSRAAVVPAGGSAAYTVAKSGVSALTAAVAAELLTAGDEIAINAVAPSTIDTAANRAAMPDADFTRWADPTDIASAIVWLASPANKLTSGSVVPVFGRG